MLILGTAKRYCAFTCNFKIRADHFAIDIPALVKPKLSDETPIDAIIVFQLN
jgi:hypothetical protein